MRKSTIIAHCLVNTRAYSSVADAEAAVRTVFRQAFPEQNCADWNADVDARAAAEIIRGHDRDPAPPDVRQLIDQLRPLPGASEAPSPR